VRLLANVDATPEQLRILADTKPGFHLIRGAAGSGKTTTALLRLRQLCASRLNRRARLGVEDPVRVLVLTYNRTLEGYISELARQQVTGTSGLVLRVSTFSRWAIDMVGRDEIIDRDQVRSTLHQLSPNVGLSANYLADEVEYLLGRFQPDQLNRYLTARRDGRGQSPRVERAMKERILAEVVTPYATIKRQQGWRDWNDIATAAANAADNEHVPSWDVAILDESQDFSANQIRAVVRHLALDHTTTFVMDRTQRIYPRYFTWIEVGVVLTSNHLLRANHRNTRQIAAFAHSLVEGLPHDDDGALPDFQSCNRDGELPRIIAGRFSTQVTYALHKIRGEVDLTAESVAFLHPKGGGWFDHLRERLRTEGVDWCELTRTSEWPQGPESVALCTIHSAKGLEFDHVFILGLNQQVTPHGTDAGDERLDTLRRLLAMAVGRARRTVTVGYKPSDMSTLVNFIKPDTYERINLA
jgi:superfamily I DNA/RNA helicase